MLNVVFHSKTVLDARVCDVSSKKEEEMYTHMIPISMYAQNM